MRSGPMQRQRCVLCDEIFDDEGEETDISCDGCAQALGLDRAPQAHSGCFVKYNRVGEIRQSADGIIDWWCGACIPTVEPAAPIAAAPAPLTQDERDEFERLQDLTRNQSIFIDRLQTQIEGQAAVTSPPAAPPVPAWMAVLDEHGERAAEDSRRARAAREVRRERSRSRSPEPP